jgi:glutathione S-transferase
MKLYYSKGACSLAVRIIINELGASAEYEAVDLAGKKTANGNNFYDINPKGAVPTLVTDKKNVITEGAVILQYLADTYKASQLLPPIDDSNRYKVLEWLNYVATEMHKGCGILFNKQLTQETKDSIFIPMIKNKLKYLDNHLSKNAFLVANQFTLPDAYLYVTLTWLVHFKFDFTAWPNVANYMQELLKRPAVTKSLKEEGLL